MGIHERNYKESFFGANCLVNEYATSEVVHNEILLKDIS